MTQGFCDEFETIQILLDSDTKTGRTDAFIIAYTKIEKQVRRLFTYIVYQFPTFELSHYKDILTVIASKRFLFFENFIKGFDNIYPQPFDSIIGSGKYTSFVTSDFPRIRRLRNKILHGQPTGKHLSATDLEKEIQVMQSWCKDVAESMNAELGFDGLEWNSFRKNKDRNFSTKYKVSISDLNSLDSFIEANMR